MTEDFADEYEPATDELTDGEPDGELTDGEEFEADPADLVEQRRGAQGDEPVGDADDVLEADPADVADQRRVVPVDEGPDY